MRFITKAILFCAVLIPSTLLLKAQNIGINEDGSSPDPSAILDVKSSDKGILVPRLSSGQMNSVSSPTNGLLIYNTTTESFWFYAGSWGELNQDADSSPSNEIQTISKSFNTITLSHGGGSIIDDDQDDDWNFSGPNLYRYSGNVAIGGFPGGERLLVNGTGRFTNTLRASAFAGPSGGSYYLNFQPSTISMRVPGDVYAQRYLDIEGGTAYYLDPAHSGTSLRTAGEVEATRFVDRNSSSYYLDPSASTSLRAFGDIYGRRYMDTSTGTTYFLDLGSTGTSLFTQGQLYGSRLLDSDDTYYYLDLSSTGTSLRAAGSIYGNRFIGSSCPSYYFDPCDGITSINVAGTMVAPSLRITTGSANGRILQSDATGNATWVDPSSVFSTGGVTHEVVHNEAVNGTFWTHPDVNIRVEYNPTTRELKVVNNTGLGYWDVSIFGNSGPGNSTTCQDINTVVDIANGAGSTFSVSSCTTTRQGFSIMAADETGTTTGFKMDLVIYNNRVNAFVASW